ncbi:hypothetical protein Tco_1366874, partial [Tanacetum coccineum]
MKHPGWVSADDIIEVGVDVTTGIDVPNELLMSPVTERLDKHEEIRVLAEEKESTRLQERVSVLEGSNMRLRRELAEERERADCIWHHMGTMTVTRSGMNPEAIEEMINQRVAKALAEHEANRNVGPVVESESQNGDDDRNGRGN